MLNKLFAEYENMFEEDITLGLFLDLEESEQIKILKECIRAKKRIYENKYFNDKYMERNY